MIILGEEENGRLKEAEKEMENEQVEVAPEDQWKIPYLEKLLLFMQEFKYKGMDKEQEELKELINSLVI